MSLGVPGTGKAMNAGWKSCGRIFAPCSCTLAQSFSQPGMKESSAMHMSPGR